MGLETDKLPLAPSSQDTTPPNTTVNHGFDDGTNDSQSGRQTTELPGNGADNNSLGMNFDRDGRGGRDHQDQAVHSRIANFSKYTYPNVCSICRSLWDRTGSTDLITPCDCSNSKLRVHDLCLRKRVKDKKRVRCEECRSIFTNQRLKELKANETVQRSNMCLIIVLMPLGTILIVTVCLLLDSVESAKREAEATGVANHGIDIPVVQFGFLCILIAVLVLAGLCLTKLFICPKRRVLIDTNTIEKI